MPAIDLFRLAIGDRVQHELRVVNRLERQKSSGEPFILLTLGNASGQIETEPLWANLIADGWCEGVERGVVVQAIGNISEYGGRRQLRLTQRPGIIPKDRLRIEEFLPSISQDTAKLWELLDGHRARIQSSTVKAVLSRFFDDESFRLQFERMPASIGGHHSKMGGLLLHVSEVTHVSVQSAKAMRANADLVTAGALLHDIGKVEAYDLSWEGFVRTPAGHLLEHVVLGALMLDRALAAEPQLCTESQRLELLHLILSHHGQLAYGSPVRPLTLEAEVLHYADQMSAKATDMTEALGDEEAFKDGTGFGDRARLWRVDRRSLWRGADWE
jgi:3'-5' exoribonuclease